MYTEYRKFPFFAARAALLVARYPTASTILVVGCGPGFGVDELIKAGKPNTWGVDGAAYAVSEARSALAAGVASRVRILGTGANAVRDAKIAMGYSATMRFDLIVTEDVLPCCSAAEATALLTQLRAHGTALFHVVTPGTPGHPAKLAGLTWKTIPEWRAAVGPGEPILDAETWEVLD